MGLNPAGQVTFSLVAFLRPVPHLLLPMTAVGAHDAGVGFAAAAPSSLSAVTMAVVCVQVGGGMVCWWGVLECWHKGEGWDEGRGQGAQSGPAVGQRGLPQPPVALVVMTQ